MNYINQKASEQAPNSHNFYNRQQSSKSQSLFDFKKIIESTQFYDYFQKEKQIKDRFSKKHSIQFSDICKEENGRYFYPPRAVDTALRDVEKDQKLMKDYLLTSLELQEYKSKIYQQYICFQKQQMDQMKQELEQNQKKLQNRQQHFALKYYPWPLANRTITFLESHCDEFDKLTTEINEKNNQIQNQRIKIQQLICTIKGLEAQINTFNQALITYKSLVQKLDEAKDKDQYPSNKNNFKFLPSNISEYIVSLSNRLVFKEQKRLQLESMLHQKERQLQNLSSLLEQYFQSDSQLISTIGILAKQVQDWKNLYQRQKQQNDNLYEELNGCNRITKLQEQTKVIIAAQLKGVAAQFYARKNTENTITDKNIRINSLEQTLADSNYKISKLQTQMKRKSQQKANLQNSISYLKQSQSQLQIKYEVSQQLHKQVSALLHSSVTKKINEQEFSKQITSKIIRQVQQEFNSSIQIPSLQQLKRFIRSQKSTILTVSPILESKIKERRFLISAIESFTKKTILKSELLYRYDQLNKNFASYLTSQKYPFIILFKLQKTGRICGAFSLGLSPTNKQSGDTFLFSLYGNGQCFYKKERLVEIQLQPISFLNNYLIFGNTEILLKNNSNRELKITLNIFGNKYYQIDRQVELVGEQGEYVKFSEMEIHRIEL